MKTIFRSEADANTTGRRFHIAFNGDALEYFWIWIVNLLYTILTLGLYYPWAKVRNKRYLVANFSLGGSTGNFDYLAPGRSVFLGVVIVGGLLAINNWVSVISVTAAASSSVILFLLFPWFLVRSMAFSARYTCFRGLRFSFDREYLPVYFAYFILLGPLVVSSIGLLFSYGESPNSYVWGTDPNTSEDASSAGVSLWGLVAGLSFLWAIVFWPRTQWALHKYKVEHYSLGLLGFSFETRLGAYYGAFIKSALLPLLGLFLLWVFPLLLFLYPIWIVLFIGSFFFLYRAFLTQRFWSGVWLKGGQGRIRMEYPVSEYVFVQFMMAGAALFSLGLLRPWARVYQCEYLARHTFLEAAPGLLDGLMEGDEQAVNAIGAEFIDQADLGFDMDFGLG